MQNPKIRNMEEFAKASGISRPTVSKYFQDPMSVRRSTRERIETALRTYDYQPNIYAMNQNRRRTNSIGIIVPNLADPFFTEIGRVVELACIDAGYSPIVRSSHGKPAQETANLEALKALKPAGILLAPFGRASDRDHVRAFAETVPMVLFDADIEEAGAAFVGTDNVQSIGLMTDYLCRTGEPPCLFEMRTPLNPNANKRRLAYLAGMERHGHEPRIVHAEGSGWSIEEFGLREGRRLLEDGAFPSRTILCSNDRLAIGLLSAAFGLGIKVGHGSDCELRIAGHDDHPFSRFTCPSLTTIAQDYGAIAELAVQQIAQVIETESMPCEREISLFDGKLVMRESA
ncbi:LacI family DNA-binding transcriptional regulator [Profundibacterium mesophilum]|nr:LacI family DNA-binding transcriptional regulator [Profundibacterium mesophilum]